MIRKIINSFLLACFFLISCSVSVFAANEFTVDAVVSYSVNDSGKTHVTHDITLQNNFSTLYATTYSLSLENIDAQNVFAVDDKNASIPFTTIKNGDKTEIKLTFSEAVVGKDAKRHFFISYDNSSFAVRTGEIWEVSIPRLNDTSSFRNYTVNLNIPLSFGLEAYISPKPISSIETTEGKNYQFEKSEVAQTGITAGFGQFQVFSFNLSYHLENPLAVSSQTQIALPPDTAFQKVYFSKIEPKPTNVAIDADGNWLAIYKLSPRQRIDVVAVGSVQIFASYRKFPKPSMQVISDNLKPTDFWQASDPQIKQLATTLKTPQSIYDYVSKSLKYDFTRVQPNVQRLGALKALENPTQAICMEFTDLFIALARAAGVPAREVNGYAYTENPELQPLSLVADVLHSWPEYYDSQKGAWIPVDPTWGSTTGGVDYFSKLDLRHFAFVMHGVHSTQPYPPGSYKLGSNPQKDVFVSFGKLPDDRTSIPKITVAGETSFPFSNSTYHVEIYNPGPGALYAAYPTVYFDGKEHSRDFIEILPPFAKYEMNISVPFSLLGNNTPDVVKVALEGTEIQITTNKTQVIIGSLLILLTALGGIMMAILVKMKRITFKGLRKFGNSIYGKFSRKTHSNSNKA